MQQSCQKKERREELSPSDPLGSLGEGGPAKKRLLVMAGCARSEEGEGSFFFFYSHAAIKKKRSLSTVSRESCLQIIWCTYARKVVGGKCWVDRADVDCARGGREVG